MSSGAWPVEEGSLALALMANFIHHQVAAGALSRADAETILQNTINGAGVPAAQASVRHALKRLLPDLDC